MLHKLQKPFSVAPHELFPEYMGSSLMHYTRDLSLAKYFFYFFSSLLPSTPAISSLQAIKQIKCDKKGICKFVEWTKVFFFIAPTPVREERISVYLQFRNITDLNQDDGKYEGFEGVEGGWGFGGSGLAEMMVDIPSICTEHIHLPLYTVSSPPPPAHCPMLTFYNIKR